MTHRKSGLVSANDGECTIKMPREYREHPLCKQVRVFEPFASCERLVINVVRLRWAMPTLNMKLIHRSVDSFSN